MIAGFTARVPEEPTIRVYPSPAARAPASMPTAPAPPLRLSTTTRCGQAFDRPSAMKRATMSVEFPGGKGTMTRTGRVG